MAVVDVRRQAADRKPVRRRDEHVGNEPVRDRVAALLDVIVDRCQRVDVVRELVGEEGLGHG